MATLAVSTFGLLAVQNLPVDLLPDLSYPTLTIQTEYPDAAPETVEQFVTRPIEEAVGVIPGVREMRSQSRSGLSEVVLEFEWGESMDTAGLDVRETARARRAAARGRDPQSPAIRSLARTDHAPRLSRRSRPRRTAPTRRTLAQTASRGGRSASLRPRSAAGSTPRSWSRPTRIGSRHSV